MRCKGPSIRDRVLRKRGLDGDNSCLKFIIFFQVSKKKMTTLFERNEDRVTGFLK